MAEVKSGIKGKVWAAHYAGKERECCHLENLANLDKIPCPYGFKAAVFPTKIERASGGWVRAVARIPGSPHMRWETSQPRQEARPVVSIFRKGGTGGLETMS